jgi:hypothetical protein
MTQLTNSYYLSGDFSKRVSICKVWFTIMVLFIHSYTETVFINSGNVVLQIPEWLATLKYIITEVFSRTAVPGFFIISAIFLYRKQFSWWENVKKKFKTLMIPYFIMNTFWVVFYFVCQHIPAVRDYFSNAENVVANWGILGWLNGYGITAGAPLLYPLWFLKYLFLMNVLSKVYLVVIKKFPVISALVLLGVWLYFDNEPLTQTICFWGFGCILAVKQPDFEKLFKWKWIIAAGYVLLVVADTVTRHIVPRELVNKICILWGIVFWFVCTTEFKSEKVTKWLLTLSSYAFGIYLFHEMNLYILKKLLAKLLPQTPLMQLVQYFGIPVAIFCFCLVVSVLMKKYLPRLYSLVTGSRSR